MKYLIYVTVSQFLILLLLFAKDKNDGGKEFFRAQPWTSSYVVIIISIINVIAYIVYFLSNVHIIQPFFNANRLYIFHLLLFLIVVVIILRGEKIFEIIGFRKLNIIKPLLLGVCAAIAIWLTLNLLYIVFGNRDYYAIGIVNDLKGLRNYLDSIMYILVVVAIAPITEEFIYRGMLYSPFRKKYGPIIAPIFNALLFAAGHYGPNIGPFFIAGILFCLLYEKTESIVSCIIAHSVSNLLGILSAFYFMNVQT